MALVQVDEESQVGCAKAWPSSGCADSHCPVQCSRVVKSPSYVLLPSPTRSSSLHSYFMNKQVPKLDDGFSVCSLRGSPMRSHVNAVVAICSQGTGIGVFKVSFKCCETSPFQQPQLCVLATHAWLQDHRIGRETNRSLIVTA